jgi:Fic family protein
MCTGGLIGIGSFFDFFTLPGQVREANILKAIRENTSNVNIDAQRSWRSVNDGEARIIREKESIERVILKLAKENKGILSASEVALGANVSIDEARRDLDAMVSKGFAELRVRQSGTLVYTIPDLMDQNEPLLDL